jgi:hypothetical protein
MSNHRKSRGSRSQRLKLAAIPVLAVGLLVLLFRGGAEPPDTAPAPATTAAASPSEANTVQTAKQLSAKLRAPQWPQFTVEQVLQRSPFVLPSTLQKVPEPPVQVAVAQQPVPPEPKPEPTPQPEQPSDAEIAAAEQQQRRQELAQRLDAWRRQPVSLIFTNSKGRTALIGSRTVSQGDLLDEGIRVVEISPNEVVLAIELSPNARP